MTVNFNKIGNYLGFPNVKGRLDDLRNQSIMAHGTKAISKKIIEENYDGPIEKLFVFFEELLQNIKKMEQETFIELPNFNYLNEKIQEILTN